MDQESGMIVLNSKNKTKIISKRNIQDQIVFLGVYAGEHIKEINIDSFF
jgi:hypothetical protein